MGGPKCFAGLAYGEHEAIFLEAVPKMSRAALGGPRAALGGLGLPLAVPVVFGAALGGPGAALGGPIGVWSLQRLLGGQLAEVAWWRTCRGCLVDSLERWLAEVARTGGQLARAWRGCLATNFHS